MEIGRWKKSESRTLEDGTTALADQNRAVGAVKLETQNERRSSDSLTLACYLALSDILSRMAVRNEEFGWEKSEIRVAGAISDNVQS